MSENQRQKQQQLQKNVVDPKGQEQAVAKTKNKKKKRKGKNLSTTQHNSSLGEVKDIKTDSAGTSGNNLSAEKQDLKTSQQSPIKMPDPIAPVSSRKAAGSNWYAALGKIVPASAMPNEQADVVNVACENISPQATATLTKSQLRRQKRRESQAKYVAIDCEMVGVGINGLEDMLARVSIVNRRGDVLLDKYVKPQEPVVDYRTRVSGIRPHNIDNGEDMKTVQDEVVKILKGKVLIGHGIKKDLAVLRIVHPRTKIRDTAYYTPLRKRLCNGRTPSLKLLSKTILQKDIQTGEHDSVEDARAVMKIYNSISVEWEKYIRKGYKSDK